ncbi:MAG: PAS domain-containing protein [Acidimicrobiales bacterium]
MERTPASSLRTADFERLAEAIPHMVWTSQADGSTDYFNRVGTDYTGLPPQANYGWGWVALLHPADGERARLGWRCATATRTPFELSFRIRRHDGSYRWHLARALPVHGERGEVVKWIGTADDIDALQLPADEAARVERQTAELRNLLEAARPGATEARATMADPAVAHARLNAALADEAPVEGSPAPVGGGRAGEDAIKELPPRDVSVLRLIASGYSNAEMANFLGISLRSVEASRARLRRDLGLSTRAQLVRFALDAGLGEPRP